jgi:hypothetical protein
MTYEIFYFVTYAKKKTALTVTDLSEAVSYERDEFAFVNDQNFYTPGEAIEHAKALAAKYNLGYEPFESRYNSSLSETNNLTLD